MSFLAGSGPWNVLINVSNPLTHGKTARALKGLDESSVEQHSLRVELLQLSVGRAPCAVRLRDGCPGRAPVRAGRPPNTGGERGAASDRQADGTLR